MYRPRRRACPIGTYYPLVHCGTSFGNYKEMRIFLMHSAELREQVKKILGKLGRLVDGKLLIPEEIVHYSEWLHVMRDRIKQHQVVDVSNIRATIHPACHVYKMVPEDVIYDDTVMDGNRVAVSTGFMQTLGAQVIDYSTWYDCCGFGFRHIIGEREFTRSFAIDRKIKVAVEEAKADVMVGHDTGCITTLDKNQWIGKAVDKVYALPIMADCQFAALALGAHPYKLAQLHWHASPFEGLLEKLGIDWEKAKARVRGLPRGGQGRPHRDPLRPQARDHLGTRLSSKPAAAAAGSDRNEPAGSDPWRRSGRSVGRPRAGRGRTNGSCWSKRPTGSAARRSSRAMPSWCRRANGRRTRLAAWCSASRAIRLIEVRRNVTVKNFAGGPGEFPRRRCPTATSVEAGAAILATGFTHFDSVNKPEWGFGTYPDVVTTTQVEQMFSSGKGVRCPSDGRKPERVAILLVRRLARSADRPRMVLEDLLHGVGQHRDGNPRSSCRNATSTSTTWISAPSGSMRDTYYWESQEKHKVKYIKARIAEVTSDGKRLIVKGEDTLVKRPITIPFDMVVHAIGMDPNVDNLTLSAMFDVKLEKHGHIAEGVDL